MIPLVRYVTRPDGSTRRVSGYVMDVWFDRGFFSGISRKRWRAILAEAWHRVGTHWHRYILPKHFTHRGATEYRYAKRSDKYTTRKFQKFGHTYPLVWSGNLKRMAMGMRDVRATSKGVRIVLRVPPYIYQFRGDDRGVYPAQELRAVSGADAREIERTLNIHISHLADRALLTPLDVSNGYRRESVTAA